ncbi:hypothetical protein AA0111_g5814 [Alternaria arborescens]|uniref:hypothetical protein n=1 Tax=Alternaria arborescens TaxID=156630 RepID=UPI001074FFA4|nr:hypothetical protein AA0111_g5814 [Alternaria arborescens]RYO29654.1 hypothetical protein AA0111_g5814 [Alternaria arborescens]
MEVARDEAQGSANARVLSTTVITMDMTSQAELSITPAGGQFSQDGQRATSEPTKARIPYKIRLLLANSRMLLLGLFLMYLTSAILSLATGFFSIDNFITPRINRVVDEFNLQSATMHEEQILYGRLDRLLSSQLSRGFMETHEDCLIRGLKKVNDESFGLGFQDPHMRARIMYWTMGSCGRLQYTPQVVIHDATPQQAVLRPWANVRYRSRRILGEALEVVRLKTRSIWNRFFGGIYLINGSTSTPTVHVSDGTDTGDTSSSTRSLSKVPFGFALHCESSQPCRLVYLPVSSDETFALSGRAKAIAKLECRLRKLAALKANLENCLSFTRYLEKVLTFVSLASLGIEMAALVGVASYMAATKKAATELTQFLGLTNARDKYTIKTIGFGLALTLVDRLYIKYSEHLGCKVSVLVFGLFSLFSGFSMLLRFFIAPNSWLPDIFQFCRLVKELYLITRGCELPDGEDHRSELSSAAVMNTEAPEPKITECQPTGTEMQSDSSNHHRRNQSFKSHRRPVSPITSLTEDFKTHEKMLQEVLKEVTRLQVMKYDVESDYGSDIDTESDSEPGTEDSGFVDLAGGVTPQLTDAESGWSVVDV